MAQGVVEQDAHHAGHGARIAAAPARPGRRGDLEVDLALGGAQLELGRHGAAQLAQLDGLLAQRHVGVEPAEVEQLAGQARQAPQLALGTEDLAPGVLLVERLRRAGPPRAARSCPAARSAACAARARRSRRTSAAPPPGGAARAASWPAPGRGRRPRRGRRRAGSVHRCPPRRRAPPPPAGERADGRCRSPGAMPSRTATSSPTAAAARNAVRTWWTAVVTSVSCFWVTSTKSPERSLPRRLGSLPRTGLSEMLAGHVDGLNDDDLVVAADRACHRVGDRAQDLVARKLAACEVGVDDRLLVGHRVGDDHARVGAQAQREGAVLEPHAQAVATVLGRLRPSSG